MSASTLLRKRRWLVRNCLRKMGIYLLSSLPVATSHRKEDKFKCTAETVNPSRTQIRLLLLHRGDFSRDQKRKAHTVIGRACSYCRRTTVCSSTIFAQSNRNQVLLIWPAIVRQKNQRAECELYESVKEGRWLDCG
jgi:hypothetical protein